MRSCVARSHAAQVLKDGDLLLAVNGQPVTSYGDVETIVAACSVAAQATSVPPHQTPDPDSPSGSTRAMPAEPSPSKSSSPQQLTGKTEQSHGAAAVSSETQHQGGSPKLIKAARPDNPELDSSRLPMEPQQGAVTRPQVSVTICRGSVVQQVEVQLGSESGLGTCRLIHWCGAMFQVSKHYPFIHSVNQSSIQVLARCIPSSWCPG